jgi:predicted metal-dependent hydrolase
MPTDAAEYLVVHELVHLKELTHIARFMLLVDRYMADWQF